MGWLKNLLVFVLVIKVSSANSQIIQPNLVHDALREIREELNATQSKCAEHLYHLFDYDNILNLSGWGFKMFDASSLKPPGLLSGNIADLGAFDQCLEIEGKYKDDVIKGLYCKASIPLKELFGDNVISPFSLPQNEVQSRGVVSFARGNPALSLAVCLPDSCSAEELNKFLQKTVIKITNCQSNEKEPFDAGDWTVLILAAVLLAVIICSTAYDIHIQNKKREPAHLILIAFSWYTHGKKLLSVTNNPNQLPCLHGIRFISMMWVIIGHTNYVAFYTPSINTKYIGEWLRNYSSMYTLGATLSVDTFFVLGGLLMSYVYLSAKDKGVKFNIIMYYIHRYIRLTPALGAAILLHVTLLRFFGSGPYWPEVMVSLEKNCSKYWWSTLLYVQNYVNVSEMCLGQTWYLSVDMQLFIVSPFVLIPLGLWPRITVPLLWCLTLISMIIPFTIAYIYEIPGLMSEGFKNKDFTPMYYENTYVRFGPVVVGIILGYYVYHRKKYIKFNSMFKNTLFNLSGWLIALVSMYLIVFEENNMYNHPYNRIESSFYTGVHRVAWSIALSWIIYTCIIGHGGVVNTFLALPIFQILSRLTYSMYLLHLSMMAMKIGMLRVPINFGDYENMYNFWGDFMFTAFAAIVWTLAFESPMITIEKILFRKASKKPKKALDKVTTET